MIVLGKKDLRNKAKLRERRAYLETLLAEPREYASPSSQEWVSAERYQGVRDGLRAEVAEIDLALKRR